MNSFVTRHAPVVGSVLSGFDRLVFRGTLQALFRPRAMHILLDRVGVRLLEFGKYVQATSEALKAASLREAEELGRPIRYLQSSRTSKENLARTLLEQQPTDEGLICAFKTVEPCMSFEYHRSSNPAERGLKTRHRKCLHIYKYYLHPVFGFLNVRIQTWFPFNIQVCLNGREWLGRQLLLAGSTDFKRHDNCFVRLGDAALAQRLMDEQLATDWKAALDEIARSINPIHDDIFRAWPQSYYWCTYQSEWATDIAFATPRALGEIYPGLVEHAMLHFHSPDVMRFLGRKCHGRFEGEITTSFKDRCEGVRVKHWADGNSIKMYDKAGSVLRIETTIGNPIPFKVFRSLSNDPKGRKAWRPMRKGVADLHRRAQVSQKANENYLNALQTKADATPIARIFDSVSKPRRTRGRRVRALHLNDLDEIAFLNALTHGDFTLTGFRNKDLRQRIAPSSNRTSPQDARRLSSRISRRLRLLRDHGLLQKIPKTYRYKLTDKGRILVTALQRVRNTSLEHLEAVAA